MSVSAKSLLTENDPDIAPNGVHEAMGLCVLTASLSKPNGRRHSRRTATGPAAGREYRREPSTKLTQCLHCGVSSWMRFVRRTFALMNMHIATL